MTPTYVIANPSIPALNLASKPVIVAHNSNPARTPDRAALYIVRPDSR